MANTKTRNPNCQKETTYLNDNLLTFLINLFGELTKQWDNNKDKKKKQNKINQKKTDHQDYCLENKEKQRKRKH